MRPFALLTLTLLAACGADGPPIPPGPPAGSLNRPDVDPTVVRPSPDDVQPPSTDIVIGGEARGGVTTDF